MLKQRSPRTYLAFDLGAESGRAILGTLCDGRLTTREIHRFANEPVQDGASLHWDVARLWWEMREALAMVRGHALAGIGVDAWGVDYALLGEQGELLQNPYHYRDTRTRGVMEEVFRKVSRQEIYFVTGIQFMAINTLYQLCAAARDTPELLKSAQTLLTIPDLFHYWLSGRAVCEFTNATTTQLVDFRTRNWARQLADRLGLPSPLWTEIVEPGTVLGPLQSSVAQDFGLGGAPVIAPAAHDTGSAVTAISARDGTAFISSGTWSLVGLELDSPVVSLEALRMNFTNEGGVCGTTRFLKNVMGLWMLQCCRQNWTVPGQSIEVGELVEEAATAEPFVCLVDPDHASFLLPTNMPKAIDEFCARTQQPIAKSRGAYTRGILESLALKYRAVLANLEKLTGQRIARLRIIGGGSKNRLLNQLTADATGRTVLAGPAEATALGNLAMQFLATGDAASLQDVRALIERCYPSEVFEPRDTETWDRQAQRFEHYCEASYA
jgi:rhamnulokinase